MNGTSTKGLICLLTCEKKINVLKNMNIKCFKCKCRWICKYARFYSRIWWQFIPSISSFWLISSSIMCPRDHQHQHLHHSMKVFFREISVPTMACDSFHNMACDFPSSLQSTEAGVTDNGSKIYERLWISWHYGFVHKPKVLFLG